MLKSKIRLKLISIYLMISLITLIFVSIMVFEGVTDIGGAQATPIIVDINGGGDYTTIQAAINAASVGDTIYVWKGTYYEHITISKKLTLIGNGTFNSTVHGGGTGTPVHITANEVTLSGFFIRGGGSSTFDAGLKLSNIQKCTIINNIVTVNKGAGIWVRSSNNNTFINNTSINNAWQGINFEKSNDNVIINSRFQNNNAGVLFQGDSKRNDFVNNNCSNNIRGIYSLGSSHSLIKNNIILSNTWEGIRTGGQYHKIINNTILFNKREGIHLMHGDYNLIENNTILSNNLNGITLEYSENNKIINNTISDNKKNGMYIYSSSFNNQVINNNFNNNVHNGFYSYTYSDNLILINNTANSNLYNGFNFSWVDELIISNNTANFNTNYGFNLFTTNNFIMMNNSADLNNIGFNVTRSNNHILSNNTIINNSIGFIINFESNLNFFYHNNIINNDLQAVDDGNNTWNNTEFEGNYWSDYVGLDNGAGGRIKGDGIGDTNIPHLGLDNYPFYFNTGWLNPGIPNLNDPGFVSIDGNYSITWNSTIKTIGYILEEDINNNFPNPNVIYSVQIFQRTLSTEQIIRIIIG